jgi:single-stranded-DNA-specific exonuclease
MDMVGQLESLVKGAVKAAGVVKSFPGIVRVVSHYDADGIASAAIVVKALERAGKDFRLSFVQQLSEDYVTGMAGEDELLVLFTDLGSGFLDEIGRHLLDRERKIIILDHHQVQGEVPEDKGQAVYHVNPVLNGIDDDISGSGVSYLMARALSPVNKDLSELAIVGAIGDSQIGSIGPHWGLLGINKEILKDAEATGKVALGKGLRLWGRYGRPVHKALQYSMEPYIPEVTGSESGSVQFLQELGIELKGPAGEWRNLASLSEEETRKLATGIIKERIRNGEDNPEWVFGDVYELLDKPGGLRDANEFATMLNACGKSGNAWMGVAICLNDEGYAQDIGKSMTAYRREIGKAVDLVRKHPELVRVTEHAAYIMAGERISEHIISNVASIVEKSCLVPGGDCHRPVFAMARTEDGQVKVSGRLSDKLAGRGLNMKYIMSRTGEVLGGQGGGHAGAGGATIPEGSEERFINTVEKLLIASGRAPAGNIKGSAQNIEKAGQEAAAVNGEHNQAVAGHLIPKESQGEKHGKAETEGTGVEGEEEGREAQRGEAREGSGGSPGSQKMERQGLVRYLFS